MIQVLTSTPMRAILKMKLIPLFNRIHKGETQGTPFEKSVDGPTKDNQEAGPNKRIGYPPMLNKIPSGACLAIVAKHRCWERSSCTLVKFVVLLYLSFIRIDIERKSSEWGLVFITL
jgi:hypothetical protein